MTDLTHSVHVIQCNQDASLRDSSASSSKQVHTLHNYSDHMQRTLDTEHTEPQCEAEDGFLL